MHLAVAHEWMVRYAGSERVVEAILEAYPDSRLLTTLAEPDRLPPILRHAYPSSLQLLPAATRHHEWLLPAMPMAWALRPPIDGVSAVVSSSHACAKAVRIAPGIPHLCYCHTPMRYAWDFESERDRFPPITRPAARAAMSYFRRWDRKSADNVDVFVANSSAVAQRIERFYRRRASIIHPPVDTEFFTPGGQRTEAFLYVGRLVGYKRPDLVIDAFADLNEQLLVVGKGQLEARLKARATPNVSFLGEVDEHRLLDLYRSACAVVFPADEDFGITMAEAHACGTPVIGLDRGGARDIVEHGTTGWLVKAPTVRLVQEAVHRAAETELDPVEIRRRGEQFSAARFRSEITAALETMVDRARDPRGFEQLRTDGLESPAP